MKDILVTGATGLVGSAFIKRNSGRCLTAGQDAASSIKINLTSKKQIKDIISHTPARFIVNFAGFTAVDAADQEMGDSTGIVYRLNALAPQLLARECLKSGKYFLHISTDFVFDGKNSRRPYRETDTPHPLHSWYSLTKYYAEEGIRNLYGDTGDFAVVRFSYPFSPHHKPKLDIARAVVSTLRKGQVYYAVTDQKIKPVAVTELARAITFIINRRATGIFHLSPNYPSGFVTPHQFAVAVAQALSLDNSLIRKTSFSRFYRGKSPRPRNTWTDASKICAMGFCFKDTDSVLAAFQKNLIL